MACLLRPTEYKVYLCVLQDEHRLHLQEALMTQAMPQLNAVVERHDVFKLQLQSFHELIGKVGRPTPGVLLSYCHLFYSHELDQFLG